MNDWWTRANCRDVDPEVFEKPVTWRRRRGKHGKEFDRWYKARAICRACPVRSECLDFALAEEPLVHNHHHYAFIAGLEPNEVAELRERIVRR